MAAEVPDMRPHQEELDAFAFPGSGGAVQRRALAAPLLLVDARAARYEGFQRRNIALGRGGVQRRQLLGGHRGARLAATGQ